MHDDDRVDSYPMFPPWLWASIIASLAFTAIALGYVAKSMEQAVPPAHSNPLTVVVGPSAPK